MTARIMMIIPTLVQGGAEKQMSLLAAGLPKEDFDVSVCVLTHSGPWESFLRDQGIEVTVIGKRFKADPIAAVKLWQHLRRVKPDLVHTWIFAANSYGRIAAKWAGVPKIIAGERCVDLWKTEKHFWLDRKLAASTNKIVTNSSGVVDFYDKNGIDRKKFSVVPNGIDLNQTTLPADETTKIETRKKWCQQLAIPESAKLIVSLARLWPQKRLKDVIWSLDLANCVQDDLHLIVAGEGPEEDALRQFALETNTQANVHFVGHLNDPKTLLAAADLFVLASEYEGQSNSLMEAISYRVPVAVSDIPGNRDLIPDESFGGIFPVGDRAELAKVILDRFKEPASVLEKTTKAWQRLQQDFSLPKMIENYANLYNVVLGQGN